VSIRLDWLIQVNKAMNKKRTTGKGIEAEEEQ
jgi:hypothetical protein